MVDRPDREDRAGGARSPDPESATEPTRKPTDAVDGPANYVLDPEGRILGWSRGAERLGGFRTHELQGTHFSALFSDEDGGRRHLDDLLRRAAAEGSATDDSARLRIDEVPVAARLLLTASRDASGRLLGFSAITQEVGADGRHRPKSPQAGDRFQSLFENAPAILIIVDRSGAILLINQFGAEYLGYDPEELIGRSLIDIVYEPDRDAVQDEVETASRSGNGVLRWDFRKVRKDGRIIWVKETARPMKYAGEDQALFLVCDDVSERKAAEEALRESEEQHRALIDLLPQYAWSTDPNGDLEFLSGRWHDYTGRTDEELGGGRWLDLVHEEDREEAYERWRYSLETGEPLYMEARFRGATGEYHWFLSEAIARRNAAGEIIQWIGTLTDIEDRKGRDEERERLLEKEREARLAAEQREREERALREAVANVSAALSTDEVIRQLARSAVDATASDGAMVSWILPDRGLVESIALAGEAPPHQRIGAYDESYTRMAVDQEEPLLVPRLGDSAVPLWGGSLPDPFRDWSMLVIPLFGADHPIGGLLLFRRPENRRFTESDVLRAVTFGDLAALAFRRLDLMEIAQQRSRELEALTESRTRLMRGFSHDLKNPLGAADGHAQLLEEGILGDLDEKQKESVESIRRSIQAALTLIQDLLELARAESGQIELQRSAIHIAEVTREAAADFEARAVAGDTTLEVRAPDGLSTVSDPTRVRQILGNLLSNAVKYSAGGRVTVTAERTRDGCPVDAEECVAIAVADTGPGIPGDQHENIFHEFTRLGPDRPEGTGLGLAISRHVARLLDGDITLESEVGRGSTFTLWLPVRES